MTEPVFNSASYLDGFSQEQVEESLLHLLETAEKYADIHSIGDPFDRATSVLRGIHKMGCEHELPEADAMLGHLGACQGVDVRLPEAASPVAEEDYSLGAD